MAVALLAASVSAHEQQVRRLLASAATGVVVGIALAVLGATSMGAVVTVGSLVLLVYSVHRFGRVGPDARPRRRHQ